MNFGPEHIGTAALVAFVISVAFVDMRTHRIPNDLCLAAAIAGLVVQICMHSAAGALAGLGGMTVGLLMFLPFYVLRAFGAGDVKAMAAVGMFLGPEQTVVAVAYTLICGGVIGAAVLLKVAGSPASALYRLLGVIVMPFSGVSSSVENAGPRMNDRFPYGVAIAAGVLTAVFWHPGL
jgi:prepilin peptidase CpaA